MSSSRPLICIATSIHRDFDARIFRHARAVVAMGFDVDLVCPWAPGPFQLPPGLRIVPFERVVSRAARPALIPIRMMPLLLAKPYGVYHFHDLDALPMFAAIRAITRRPVVYDCHENYGDEMNRKVYLPSWTRRALSHLVRWGERIAAAPIRDVVIVVPKQRNTFPSPFYRTTLVPNYAELSLESGRADDYADRPDICLSIASQYVENGALFMVDVAAAVKRRRSGVKFHSVDRFPSPDVREQVMRRVEEEDLADTFQLIPGVLAPEIMNLLNGGTIALALDLPTPTRIGALPLKLFEYMAAGLPIVASDLPNSRSVIEDAGCGLLAEPCDPESFATAICQLVDDRTAAMEMGERGLAAFRDRYNWECEVQKLGPIYEQLLGRRV